MKVMALPILRAKELRSSFPRSFEAIWSFPMASSARIFFAGVGTTFAILAVGFGGGILLANSTFSGTSAQKQASSETPSAARIVHPNSAEPTLASSTPEEPTPSPQLAKQAVAAPTPMPSSTPVDSAAEHQPRVPSQVEERSKTSRELRADRRQRHAERKGRRHPRRLDYPDQHEPGIVAFDGDQPPPRTGIFGN